MHKFATAKYVQSMVIRRYLKVAAFAVFLFVGMWLVFVGQQEEVVVPEKVPPEPAVTQSEDVLQAAYPEHIRIPKIGIDAAFEAPLGVDDDGEIEVPESYETVGYYKYGPTPGELGPAVVLGHVDSYKGPAVFYSLGQLEKGDTIEIDRDDGTVAVFEVERLERHRQADFPTQKVYGDLDYAGLRLITCTGTYDRGVQRYSHNLIVFARLSDNTEVNNEKKLDI